MYIVVGSLFLLALLYRSSAKGEASLFGADTDFADMVMERSRMNNGKMDSVVDGKVDNKECTKTTSSITHGSSNVT